MEKKITFNGKRVWLSELELPQDFKEKLYSGFYTETNLKNFSKKLGISEEAITILFEDYLEKIKEIKEPYITDSLPIETIMGNKEEPYFENEEEISKDLDCNYTWEQLTLHEQQFYLNYEGQNRKRCFVRKRNEASDSESDGIQQNGIKL
jgi:hypothetical protein